MRIKKDYPYWRVLIGFTLCPALASLSFTAIFIGLFVLEGSSKFDDWVSVIFPLVGGLLWSTLAIPVIAMIFFGVPAFFLALFYVVVGLRRSMWGFVMVFSLGGGGAWCWNQLIANSDISGAEGVMDPTGVFVMGAISSIVMAFFVLPKPVTKDKDTSKE